MRRSFSVPVVAMALLVTACGSKAPAPAAPSSSATPSTGAAPAPAIAPKLKVAMLLPGKVNDQSWNAAGNAALEAAKKQEGVEGVYVEDVQPSNQNEVYRDYAAKGYNLIISWGGTFEDGAKVVSKEFPKISFMVLDGASENGSNYASYDMATEQFHFLGGAAAGLVTKSHVVGVLGGLCFPNTARAIHGYEQGAKLTDPSVKILTAFTGDFEDTAKAKAAALSMINQGADVIMMNLNAGIQGVIEAAKEKNVFVIPEWADLNALAPNNIITSVLMDQSVLVVKAVQDVKKGSFKGKRFVQNVQIADQVNLAPLHGLAPDTVWNKLTEIQRDIAGGRVQVKSDESCK